MGHPFLFAVGRSRSKAALRFVNSTDETSKRSFASLRMTNLITTAKAKAAAKAAATATAEADPFASLRDDNLKNESPVLLEGAFVFGAMRLGGGSVEVGFDFF
jgi:hypothetical protein